MGLFQELRRRKIFRVAAIYGVTGWLIAQIVAVINEPLRLPGWFDTAIIVLIGIGFPIALVLAYAFEVTPDGVVRRTEAAESAEAAILPPGRSKLDYVFMGLLALAVGWLLYRTEIAPTDEPVVTQQEEPDGVLHNSIAVLPFDNLSPNPDDAYFAAGIHEEILNQLAKIKDLSVIARTTMMRFADSGKSVPEVAAELNVGTVMEGSVRYAGERVRITAQLIDAGTGAHLWSEAYDRDLEDIFAIQSDIALKITDAMKAEFSVAEQQAIATVLSENPDAYAHYVKALSLFRGFSSTAPVHEELDAAIALDPNFAAALAAKGYLHGWEVGVPFEGSVITPESERRNATLAIEFARRALAINPDEAGGYLALSLADTYYRRWDDAVANAEKAYDLNPNQTVILAQYADRLATVGRAEEAIEAWHRVVALDPQNYATHTSAAFHFYLMERWHLVKAAAQNTIALFPDSPAGYTWLGVAHAFGGDQGTALEAARKAETLDPSIFVLGNLGNILEIYAVLGRSEDISRAFAKFQQADQESPLPTEEWFYAYMNLGEVDKALDLLSDAIDTNSSPLLISAVRAYWRHPGYDTLRDHPRFQDALRKLGAIQ